MTKEKFYDSVYSLVNDYISHNHKQPKYLFINADFDLTTFLDSKDLYDYIQNSFKGMMIVRSSEVAKDEVVVH